DVAGEVDARLGCERGCGGAERTDQGADCQQATKVPTHYHVSSTVRIPARFPGVNHTTTRRRGSCPRDVLGKQIVDRIKRIEVFATCERLECVVASRRKRRRSGGR